MPAIRFNFVVDGADAIVRGFRQVEQAAAKASSSVARTSERAARASTKAAEKQAKETVKAEKLKDREAERSHARAVQREQRHTALVRRMAAERGRELKKERDAFTKRVADRAKFDAGASELTRSRVGSVARGVGGLALSGAALAMGTVGAGARDAANLQERANRLSINSRQAGQDFRSADVIAKAFVDAAKSSPGQTSEGIAAGADTFVAATGDLDGFMRSLDGLTKVASATGANFEDVASTAAALQNQFKITDPEKLKEAMATLTFAGKAGAFELSDAARLMSRVAASASGFGLDGMEGLKETSGLLQIARSATGNGEQAATATENVFTALNVKQSKFEAAGVNFADKDGNKLGLNNVLAQAVSKMEKGDLMKLFGEQGSRALLPLIAEAEDAKKAAGGGEKGEAAAMEVVAAKLRKAGDATTDFTEILKDAAQAESTTNAQLTATWENLISAVQTNALPAINDLAPQLTKLANDAIPPAVTAFTALVQVAGPLAVAFGQVTQMIAGFIDSLPKGLRDQLKGPEFGDSPLKQELATIQGMKEDVSKQMTEAAEDGDTDRLTELKADFEALGEQERLLKPAIEEEERIIKGTNENNTNDTGSMIAELFKPQMGFQAMANIGTMIGRKDARNEIGTGKVDTVRQQALEKVESARAPAVPVDDGGLADKARKAAEALDALTSAANRGKGIVERTK